VKDHFLLGSLFVSRTGRPGAARLRACAQAAQYLFTSEDLTPWTSWISWISITTFGYVWIRKKWTSKWISNMDISVGYPSSFMDIYLDIQFALNSDGYPHILVDIQSGWISSLIGKVSDFQKFLWISNYLDNMDIQRFFWISKMISRIVQIMLISPPSPSPSLFMVIIGFHYLVQVSQDFERLQSWCRGPLVARRSPPLEPAHFAPIFGGFFGIVLVSL